MESTRSPVDIVKSIGDKPEQIALVDSLYSALKATLSKNSDNTVTAKNILIIIDTTMKLAGKLKNLDGIEKKALVMTVIRKLIAETDMPELDKEIVNMIVERALDPMIDQLFELAPHVYGKLKAKCSAFCK